jgi:hypothetical protein
MGRGGRRHGRHRARRRHAAALQGAAAGHRLWLERPLSRRQCRPLGGAEPKREPRTLRRRPRPQREIRAHALWLHRRRPDRRQLADRAELGDRARGRLPGLRAARLGLPVQLQQQPGRRHPHPGGELQRGPLGLDRRRRHRGAALRQLERQGRVSLSRSRQRVGRRPVAGLAPGRRVFQPGARPYLPRRPELQVRRSDLPGAGAARRLQGAASGHRLQLVGNLCRRQSRPVGGAQHHREPDHQRDDGRHRGGPLHLEPGRRHRRRRHRAQLAGVAERGVGGWRPTSRRPASATTPPARSPAPTCRRRR